MKIHHRHHVSDLPSNWLLQSTRLVHGGKKSVRDNPLAKRCAAEPVGSGINRCVVFGHTFTRPSEGPRSKTYRSCQDLVRWSCSSLRWLREQ